VITKSLKTTEKPSKRHDLSKIYNTLRERICLLEYAPGSVLREDDIAKEFCLSRTPIREVLKRLSFAGLVVSKNGVGTIITEMDPSTLVEIYMLRSKLAVMIGELSPNDCEPEQVSAVVGLMKRAEALKQSHNMNEYWKINHELHFIISALIGNTPLKEMWDHLYFQAARFWYTVAQLEPEDTIKSLNREVDDIHEAMLINDITAVGYIERNYISYGLRKIKAHFGSTADRN
jgi:DNA-binding GntR family transcriptional regulator